MTVFQDFDKVVENVSTYMAIFTYLCNFKSKWVKCQIEINLSWQVWKMSIFKDILSSYFTYFRSWKVFPKFLYMWQKSRIWYWKTTQVSQLNHAWTKIDFCPFWPTVQLVEILHFSKLTDMRLFLASDRPYPKVGPP